MPDLPVTIAVSLGDPAGVAPELICEAWNRREAAGLAPFFVIGGAGVLRAAALSRGLDIPVAAIDDPADAAGAFPRALPVIGHHDCDYTPGVPDADGARLAQTSLTDACAMVVEGHASALMTGPIAKAELAKVGFIYPGQTECVAAAAGVDARDAVMMLAGPHLRTVPMTVHCPLADVAGLLSVELITRRTRVVARALRDDFGIASPRIAITGLNPHAGEGGRMGREEIDIIAPAIAVLRAEGIDATGPHPADALFAAHARSTYDVAIAMYHDQALVPIKALDFDEGVNITLGLPVIRTSPDHGTAFGIAGRSSASAGATIAALRMAGECAARRLSARAPTL